jgi:hypothetical protein
MKQQEGTNTLLRIQQLGHDLAATIADRLAADNLPLRSGMAVLSVAVNEIIDSTVSTNGGTGDDALQLRQMFKQSLDVCDES